MFRMNLGCGPVQPAGWVNADTDPRWAAPHPASLWPTHQGKLDLIVANHVLQMVEWPQLVPFLLDCRDGLRDGGVLRLLVPDARAAISALHKRDAAWFPIADEHERSVDGKFCMYLTQAGATRSIFTAEWLIELCVRAGFYEACALEPGESTLPVEYGPTELDSRAAESIIVEARR